MNAVRLHRIVRIICLASAAFGLAATVVFSAMAAPVACCGPAFFLISGRFAVDFALAPLVAGLTLDRPGSAGTVLFWLSCAWMTAATWPPYLLLLVAVCVWTRVRLGEERGKPQSAPEAAS